MLAHCFSILAWLLNLFDPPPLASMTRGQKVGRIFLLSGTLVVVCIITAMLGALAIFVDERSTEMISNYRDLLRDLSIIVASLSVNAVCVIILVLIKQADHKLIPPPLPAAKQVVASSK